jgi:hypothetical protein
MTQSTRLLAFLFAAAAATSCTERNGKLPPTPKQNEAVAVQVDKAKTETVDAARSAMDYAYAQKAVFVDKMKREMVTIQEDLDRLSTKIDKAGGATKADAKTKLASVREQWVRVRMQLDQAEGATESTWDGMKGDFKRSYGDLQDSIATMRQWLSDTIAP